MTINERVSDATIDEIMSGVIEGVEPKTHEIAMAEEIKQYRAAAEKPIGSFHIIDQQVDGTTDYVKDGEWPIDNGELLVYAAPQVTSVPDCFNNAVSALESLYRNGQKQNWNERYTSDMAYASGVLNACRAAMLNGGKS